MLKSKTTAVKLLGQKIVLKYSDENPEMTDQVIKLASLKVIEVEKRSHGAAPHQIAFIALLDLAEEYLRSKKRVTDLKEKWEVQSSRLLSFIQSRLK